MRENKETECEKIAIGKLKSLMKRNSAMWRGNLIKLLAGELSINEGSASKLVDSLEERKLIGYIGSLMEVAPKTMAKQLVITPEGEEIIKAGNVPSLY